VSDGLVVKLLSLIVFVACSALFTGAEAAYFSLGRARLKRVAAQGAEGGAVTPLIERPHELLVTLLVNPDRRPALRPAVRPRHPGLRHDPDPHHLR